MNSNYLEVRIRGKNTKVPCRQIDDNQIVSLGRFIKVAQVHDELWTEGEPVNDPISVVSRLKAESFPAHVFTFAQKPPNSEPKHPFHFDWDNFAAIHIQSFDDWWKKLPQESRKNTRRAAKRGVITRTVELDDDLVQGITDIYNETPIRQGKPFPHFGKDFQTVKKEVATLLECSLFIAAYHETELIGFIKLVCLGEVASILHIVSKNAHYDKRPTNALITKAVEICSQRGISYLLYGRYTYGKKTSSPLIEFKRRNGFEEVRVPRYYIPLSAWGHMVVSFRLYRGLLGLLPSGLVNLLVSARARLFDLTAAKASQPEAVATQRETLSTNTSQ